MKNIAFSLYLSFAFVFASAQTSNVVKEINQVSTPAAALAPLRFLAADDLMGRSSTRPEINIAAAYIGETFKSIGLKEAPGTQNYFQSFNFKMRKPANGGTFVVNDKTYKVGTDLLEVNGGDVTITAPVIYVKHGLDDDLKNVDVKEKS